MAIVKELQVRHERKLLGKLRRAFRKAGKPEASEHGTHAMNPESSTSVLTQR